MAKRQTNIELLRIISTLMIVTLHYCNASMGGVLGAVSIGSVNYYITHIIESICIVGPNVFVAISAFFMCDSNTIKVRKILDLYLIMVFWSLLLYLISMTMGNPFSIKEIAALLFPFLAGRAWFVETYLLLMIFSPFINKMISALSRRSYSILICFWCFVYSLWPSFLRSAPATDQGYGLMNFITIYLIVAYIKKFILLDSADFESIRRKSSVIYFISTAINIVLGLAPVVIKNGLVLSLCGRCWQYDFIFNIVSAVSLFVWFNCTRMKYSKLVNSVAMATFGVICTHADPNLQNVVYHKILNCELYYDSMLLVIHLIISVILLFCFFTLLELGRQYIWKKTIAKILDKNTTINKKLLID